jgi:1,4-alpha-glucan branching enzyme
MAVKKEVTAKKAAPKAAPKTAAPKAKKPAASKGKTVEKEFSIYSPASDSVAIAGDFNNWKPLALKKGKSGNWTGKVKLNPGEYQYKIVYDGKYWEIDQANPERVCDGQGSQNSKLRV